jgi:indolepyruvate decarboxylase
MTPTSVLPMRSSSRRSSPAQETVRGLSIGQYLIRRLGDYGISHVFGIPGDYVLSFYNLLEQSPLKIVGCTREDGAGFAADAYARVHGMGAVCVTYCVGGLSLCNSTAGAYAEKSPVVVISGSPGLSERVNNPLLHHKVRDFRTQLEVFEKLCVAAIELSDPVNAFREIDRVLDLCASVKRPVYLEIPRDMVHVVPEAPHSYKHIEAKSPLEALGAAVDEAAQWIGSAKHPVIIGGVEIHRFGLQDELLKLVEGAQIPVAATMLGKSVVRETHPLYIGIYEGAMGHEEVTRYVESSDCVVLLGTFMTDINLGIFTANLDASKCIYVTSERAQIRHHHYHDIQLGDFLRGLTRRVPRRNEPPAVPVPKVNQQAFVLAPSAPLSIMRMMARLDQELNKDIIVIADIGDALFAATDLVTHDRTEFISPAYYTSMGFAVPAALGAQVARPTARTVAIVGDGAFQMTGMELSTIVRHGYPAIVIVLDNIGYGTERCLHPGEHEFNNVQPWQYHKLPEVLGGGTGYEVHTEGEFDAALEKALADTSGMSLIHAHLARDDHSRALSRLAERLSKKV